MAHILISLIGDQTAPNIFIIKDERFRHIDRHVFITTELMEMRRRLEHLLSATGIPEDRYQKILVSADDLQDIYARLDELKLSDQHQYYLNLTSGTKIMSIGLFHYFTQAGLQVQIFYLPVRKNAYRQIFPESGRGEYPLSYQISLREYLTTYGIQREADAELWRGPAALTQRIFREYTGETKGAGLPIRQWAGRLRQLYNKKAEELPLVSIDGLAPALEQIGFPIENEPILTTAQLRYLIGGWLEQWAAEAIKTQLQLPEAAIGLGVKIRPQRIEAERFGRNEFDVMFIYRNTLYILECKTGLGGSYHQVRSLFDQSLYRLAALRLEFGMNVFTGLLTLDYKLRNRRGATKPVFSSRADLLKVTVADRQELLQGPAHWVTELVPASGNV